MGDYTFDLPGWMEVYIAVTAAGFLVATACLVAGAVGAIKASVRHNHLPRWTKICLVIAAAYAVVLPASLAIVSNIDW